MRKFAVAVLGGAAAMLAAGIPAKAAPTFLYGRVDAGGSFPTGNELSGFDPSPVVGAGLGFSPLPFLRTDVTVSYRTGYSGSATDTTLLPGTTVSEKSNIKSLVGMVNAYIDLPTIAGFTPYVGGGAGAARSELGSTSFSGGGTQVTLNGVTKTNFAWQVGAGVAISILPTIALDIGYHYLDAGSLKGSTGVVFGNTVQPSARLRANEVQAGIRVGF